MNGFVVSKSRFIAIVACAILWIGCKQEAAQPLPAGATDSDVAALIDQAGPDAATILQDLVTAYANATSYSDSAELDLSYRLNGQSIREPQRWSTAWDQSGRWSARLFNGVVRCDGELLSCFVYDIDTANLDNQHLLMPYDNQLPIAQLYRDSIAKHFLAGYSELPMDETDLVSAPKLVPPPISLLTNQVRNGWLQNPTQAERLADQVVDDKPCYVVRCLSKGMTADVWIDKSTSTLVQMSLPLKLLAGEVVTSPEITDVVLTAKFHDAKLNAAVTDELFAIEPHPDATPVRKYVSLPEPFPSELIGENAPRFNLVTRNSKPLSREVFDGKVTALLWLAGQPSYSAVGQFDELAATLPADQYHLAAVYSDAELKEPGTGKLTLVDGLEMQAQKTSLPLYYDIQLFASTALKIKTIPSVIVIDGDSKIHYAKALADKTWLVEVQAAIERVAAGEDVASEMQQEYTRFLESYQQQLATVGAADLIDAPQREHTAQVSTGQGARTSMRLRPEKTWANDRFKQAGNVLVQNFDNQVRYLAFDGYRTVVTLDAVFGQTMSRVELELPEGQAASFVREGALASGRRVYAVFSSLGEQVFLFDHQWKPIGSYPDRELKHQGIRDCRFSDSNRDGVSELVVALDDEHGVHLVDPATQTGEKISTASALSMVLLKEDVVVAGQGKIAMLKTGLTNVEDTELKFRRVAAIGEGILCGLGSTSNGQWNAVGFDSLLKRTWTLSIGPQFFETTIEPIAVTQTDSGEVIWAIADTEDAIHLVSGSGKWLGDFQSESRLGGIALATYAGRTCLIVSNAEGMESWNLNLEPNPMRPVSTQK